ncbi:Zinc finger, PHD-type [Corchorus capsularis]|uniref:Zinc finger, PHD-type n=1 Tax=Corchorus capsularis TaxID=210143 RepID=A0A1R3KCU8_COCAP|nr:Zinc finger, PHD-type [Corchorus capsularis]
MAFHVACPITCRRICFCSLGFPRNIQSPNSKNGFLQEVIRVEEFLKDPWGVRVSREGTVQVPVPKVAPVPAGDGGVGGGGDAVEEAASASSQAKRLALQRKAAAAMVAAEDYARRVESGDIAVASKNSAVEEKGQSNTNVMCRMCFLGENEGSERARRMLSCRNCGKKYHRSCLKSWAQHRDLFHWSSWTCPYCRTCEVCRTTGDPTRLMFCKRCDSAYHCYCQHPSHKNVTSGPYVCPKHTRCHSCGSSVPGNGLSVRWFLGYTCCDACGRLFVKGNYCPVCLKVYRDSESTPMVCCDVCQRWVHCQCDGISDEKYLQFQVDGNLQYKCATCRGECYQVTDLEDAVRELWRRRDRADRDLIASLRAAAGLPTQEEIFSISVYSDDEENGPVMSKNEFGRSLKFSLKGIGDKSPKKNKEYGKKSSSKKYSKKKAYQASLISKGESQPSLDGNQDIQSQGYSMSEDRNNEVVSHRKERQDSPSPVAGVCSTNQPGVLKHKLVDEVMVSDEDRTSRVLKIRSNKPHDLDSGDDTGKHGSKSKTVKAKKLVINLGARKINVTNSPVSDTSNFQREQHMISYDGDRVEHPTKSRGVKIAGREGNLIKLGKIKSEVPESRSKAGVGNTSDGYRNDPVEHTRFVAGKGGIDSSRLAAAPSGEVSTLRGGKVMSGKQLEDRADMRAESNDDYGRTPVFNSLPKDAKPTLKFKLKKPNLENQNSQVQPEEEKSSIKGQRSKRKRPSPFMEKSLFNEDEDHDVTQSHQDSLMDGMMDASWILKKLGKDAIGKKVEIHQASDNSWHKGAVTDIIEGTSTLSVRLDDGRAKTLELGKQGVRFVLQKQKRSKI